MSGVFDAEPVTRRYQTDAIGLVSSKGAANTGLNKLRKTDVGNGLVSLLAFTRALKRSLTRLGL